MMHKDREMVIGTTLVATSAAGFATLAIFGKLAYAEGLDLPSTLAWRFSGAAAVLWVWLGWRAKWHISRQKALAATLLGAVGYTGQSTLFFATLAHTSAGVAALLLYTYPAFVTLLAWAIEKERPNFRQIIALGLALSGCFFTADLTKGTVEPVGIFLGLASGVWYALYLTLSARLVRSVHPITTTAYISLGAALSFTGAAILGYGLALPKSPAAVWIIIGLVLVATVLPIVTLFAGIRQIGTWQAVILSTLEPVVTVLLGIFFLGEELTLRQILGGLLVMCSVVLLQSFGTSKE